MSFSVADNSPVNSVVESSFAFPIKNLAQKSFVPTKLTTTDFKSVEFLKHGSNCYVYTAVLKEQRVVVKMLKEKVKNQRLAEQELVYEAGILARLQHPNIIGIYGVGEKVRKFIVLEYLEGGTLSQVLKSTKLSEGDANSNEALTILPLNTILTYAHSIASALKYLHEDIDPKVTIIHRGNNNKFHKM